MIVKNTGGVNYEKCPAGTYTAICIGEYELGIHKIEYMGEIKDQHQVVICWEVDERIKSDGEYKDKRFDQLVA